MTAYFSETKQKVEEQFASRWAVSQNGRLPENQNIQIFFASGYLHTFKCCAMTKKPLPQSLDEVFNCIREFLPTDRHAHFQLCILRFGNCHVLFSVEQVSLLWKIERMDHQEFLHQPFTAALVLVTKIQSTFGQLWLTMHKKIRLETWEFFLDP